MTQTRRTFFSILLGFVAWAYGYKSARKRGGKLASAEVVVPIPNRLSIKDYAVSIHYANDGWPVERVIWSDRLMMIRRMPIRRGKPDLLASWDIYRNALASRESGEFELIRPGECLSDHARRCLHYSEVSRASGSRTSNTYGYWTAEGQV